MKALDLKIPCCKLTVNKCAVNKADMRNLHLTEDVINLKPARLYPDNELLINTSSNIQEAFQTHNLQLLISGLI